ncbi:MAG TPA: anti-sigma factor, partial [Bryobacteraceae bacterium]|nr:anti-sigma factor [Bryobacteraceae bacterium]
ALSQQEKGDKARQDSVPIYQVTVERRSIRALNYGHRSEPTKIDFNGTVLLPKAEGEAKVESKGGVVEIDCKFEKLEAPTRFGPEYLTYVLWAITPDGRPVSLGEVLTDGSGASKLRATTSFQTFGLIVTAEPYFAVTQPSNVVVLENVPRPDTAGKVEQVEAKYELLPRTGNAVAARTVDVQQPASTGAKEIPLDQYEAVLALYQAQNAVQIARSQGADRFAADTLQKAEQLYQDALKLHSDKPGSKQVVMIAREAVQKAEDARTIARRHERQTQPMSQSSR